MSNVLEEFFDANNPLISDVVVYHLRIESLLEKILTTSLPRPSRCDLERMRFIQKAALVAALGKIDKPLYEIVKKLNRLRNKFAHELNYTPTFNEIHQLVVEAGKAGVDFSDGIDAPDPAYARSLSYDHYHLLNALFRNVCLEIAYSQEEEFWIDLLA